MAKRRKIKKKVWVYLILIIVLSIGIRYGISLYKEYKYKQAYEYKLTEIGYSLDDTKIIQNVFKTDQELEYILSLDKNNHLVELIQEKYFIKAKLDDYLDYIDKNKGLELNKVVTTINTNTNNDYYSLDLKTDISQNEKMIVNKYYGLDKDYTPDDLMNITTTYAWGNGFQVRKILWDAYLEMFNAAKENGIYLMINSAYRAYESQEIVFKNYEDSQGTAYAETIAARPGHSEHQTGLAIDIFSTKNTNRKTFADTEEAEWLANNSYKYGFILRYPKDKESITGYQYESWHFRYVGKDIAKYIFENDITFDEYYAYFIENK